MTNVVELVDGAQGTWDNKRKKIRGVKRLEDEAIKENMDVQVAVKH